MHLKDLHQSGAGNLHRRRKQRIHYKIAKPVKGARALLASGFEYVTDMEGYKLFRKRK